MARKRLGWLLLGVLPLLAGTIGPSEAGSIAAVSINDKDFDTGKGDGTHDTQLNPDSSFWSPMIGFTGFDRPSGTPQEVGTAYTINGGASDFIDNGNIAGGSNILHGRPSTAWNPDIEEYMIAVENTFSGSGQSPIAVSSSAAWGVTWRSFTDTYTSIPFGQRALFPSLVVNQKETSTNYGDLSLAWVLDTGSVTARDLYYQSSTPTGQNWSPPVKVNDAGCSWVGRGELTLAGDTIYAAMSCENNDGTYRPEVRVSTNNGLSWADYSAGLPTDLEMSGDPATCDSGSTVKRTVYGDLGVFDFPRIAYDEMGDMLFLTTTDHGEGTDLSDIHAFGAVETASPNWLPYAGLPGDAGATMVAPEVGLNYVKGTRNIWYSGALVPPTGDTYTIKTFVTTDLVNWTPHSFSPTNPLPVLKPNEDTAVEDCYYGHNLIDLDAMGTKIGVTYVGFPGAIRRSTGATDVDPDILFALLEVPSGEPTETSMTMAIRKTDAKIKASGGITPVIAGFGEVEFGLLKKKDGTFQPVGSPKTTTFGDGGTYKVSFNRPKRGTCRVKGEYPGNDDFAPSSVTKTFPCKK